MTEPGRSWPVLASVRLVGALALTVAMLVAASGCSFDSGTSEVADDPSDVTVAGPPPTAPREDESTSELSGATQFISDLEALSEEDDLCAVLGGETFAQLIDQELDTAGLVTSPAGVTQLIALLERTFAHLVAISPEPVRPSMEIIMDLWLQVAALGATPDAEERTAQLVAQPEVVGAIQQLGFWATQNCPELLEDP